MSQLRGIPGEFLTERERRRVLQMGAADLHNRLEIRSFGGKRGVQPVERRQQLPHHRFRRRNVHRGRKHVVRRLPAIDVVVRMHELPLPAQSAENLRRAYWTRSRSLHSSKPETTRGPHGPLSRSVKNNYAAGVAGASAGAVGGADGGGAAASSAAFIDRRRRPLSSASSTLTRTTWPS